MLNVIIYADKNMYKRANLINMFSLKVTVVEISAKMSEKESVIVSDSDKEEVAEEPTASTSELHEAVIENGEKVIIKKMFKI